VTFGGGGLPIVVDSGTVLSTGTSVIRGSGTFLLNATAALACGHPGGLDSLLQNTGTRTLSAGAGYTFNGATLQVTGTLLPSSITNLTVNNDSSVTLSAGTTVTGTLSVTRGDLNLNGNTVTLGPTAVLSETPGNTVAGGTGVITATRTLNAPSDTVDIAGLGVKIGSTANLGSTVITRGHAVQSPAGSSIKRYFDITPTNNTGLNATLRFRYDQSEINNLSEIGLRLFRSTDNGSTWAQSGGTVDTAANIITLTGVNALSRWTAATVLAPSAPQLVFPASGATSQPVSLTLRWRVATTAATYRMQLATDSLFANLVVNDSTVIDTQRAVSSLANNTRYFWRVNAKNAGGTSPYSSVFNFTTIVSLPAQVTLVSPANGATVGADSARCVWNRSNPAIINYWFERALDSIFTSPVVDSTLTDTSKVTRPLVTNTTYWWRVRAKNAAGWGPYSSARRFIAIFTGVDDTEVPLEFSLKQNYPNPFNPSTSIRFSVEKSGRTRLELFNILGQKMMTLFDEIAEPGRYYTVKLDGRTLASGVYLYRLQSGQKSGLKKLLLVK
jgi:hypothetical protein